MSKINKNNGVPTEKQGFSHGESESPERLMSAAQSVRKGAARDFNPLDWANNSVNNGVPDATRKSCGGESGSLGRFNGSVGASPCDPSAERGVSAPDLASPACADAQLAHGAHQCAPSSPAEDFEQLLTAIESSGIDLTNDYNDWYKIGIAIASEFGESGRDYFHRISKLYSSYNYKEVDKKYSQCISDPNPSITISTIYYLAKNAGITLPQKSQSAKDAHRCASAQVAHLAHQAPAPQPRNLAQNLPTFALPEASLPPFMADIYRADSSPATADMLLFGSIIALSAVMPKVIGIYGRKQVYANLFGFVAAPPASSKGKLADVIRIVQPIQDEIRDSNELEQFNYQEKLAAYKASGDRNALPPTPPKYRTLKIAANSSSTAVYQTLNDNDGCGFTAETEGDTLAMMMKSDFGNYSDGLRKAFHHEPISYLRRKDNEHVDITHPRWSVLLSGTYGQISTLIPNPENGLFSRFPFYCLPRTYDWLNVFDSSDETLERLFFALGRRYLGLYHVLTQRVRDLIFVLTPEQQQRFNDHFAGIQTEYVSLYGDDLVASVRRQGLIAYRMMMILSITRYVDTPEQLRDVDTFTCHDDDFQTALSMIDTLLQHTAFVFTQCLTPVESADAPVSTLTDLQRKLLSVLPEEFDRDRWRQCARSINVNPRTADRWLGQFVSKHGLLTRLSLGQYSKTSNTTQL